MLPVYNGSRYIVESIRSVLRQTYRPLELIVVDDGSTDDTAKEIESFRCDPRVTLLWQPHIGLPAALNHGFSAARGEFWTWTSSDNIMAQGQLTELVSFLKQREDVQVVYGDMRLIDAHGEPLRDGELLEEFRCPSDPSIVRLPRDTGRLSFEAYSYIGGAFLYRAWAARIIGDFDPETFRFEDYDFWLRFNTWFQIEHVGRSNDYYRYRVHEASLTATNPHLGIPERVRQRLDQDRRERESYRSPMEIEARGHHPWLDELSQIYRRAGHTFSLAPGAGPATLTWRSRRTPNSASRSRLILADPTRPLSVVERHVGATDWLVVPGRPKGQEPAGSICSRTLYVETPEHAAFPLMAAARTRRPSPPAALSRTTNAS